MTHNSVFLSKMLCRALAVMSLTLSAPALAGTGPVGWWQFDEGTGTSAADSSGNGNTGTLTNSPTWTTGRIGANAISFNGGSSEVTASGTGAVNNLHTTGLTVSAWIKPTGSGGAGLGRIVDKDNNIGGWFFAMNGTNQVKFTSDSDASGTTSLASTSSITLNAWQHVLVTWDGLAGGAHVHIYINGTAADGTATDGTGPESDDGNSPLTIGNRPVDTARGFAGAIDEVRIYNRVLSSTEIQALADSTAPSAPTGVSATATSSSQINLSWTASTDNVGVTGYRVERCSGSGCSSFVQIGTPTGTTYSDTGLSASTSYSYRVRATDANSNLSGYSSTASATTPSGGGGGTGPVGWWKFDEGSGTTAADSSGNGNTGTLTNSPTWTTGQIGSGALSFNGGSSEVTLSGAGVVDDLHVTGLTVSAWIKPTGSGGGGLGRIVDKDNNIGGWFFAMNGTNQVKFTSDSDTSGTTSRASTSSITLNAWQNVLVTWDGTAGGAHVHIYVNGTAADGTSTDGTGPEEDEANSPLTIGNRPFDTGRGFAGVIDDVRIYNRVLSSTEIQTLADATPPSAPTGLSATAASSSTINLSWTASTDNVGVTGYRVERCSGSGCSSFVQIATPTGTTYSDTGLSASTSYSYRVRATDANNNLSAYSSTASATTPGGGDTTPPSTPTGLGATAASSSQINLSWTASTDNVGVTGYRVERCQGSGCSTFTQVGTPTGTTYSDTGLTASTSYTYRVRATDAAGNLSGYSNTASATTTGALNAPSGLVVVATSSVEGDIAWTAASGGSGGISYLIERCSGAGCNSFSQVGGASITNYASPGLSPSTSYSFRVRATDGVGDLSAYSNTVTFSTPASSPDCD